MQEESTKVAIDSYYIPQKVAAFTRSYLPCSSEMEASEVFTDEKLRRYFQAYPIPTVGDLLIPYLDALEAEGFHLQTSVTGEPAIFVVAHNVMPTLLPGLLTAEEEKEEEGSTELTL